MVGRVKVADDCEVIDLPSARVQVLGDYYGSLPNVLAWPSNPRLFTVLTALPGACLRDIVCELRTDLVARLQRRRRRNVRSKD